MDAKNILGSNKDLLSSSLRPYYMSILCSFDLDKEIKWKKILPSASACGMQIVKAMWFTEEVDDNDGGKYFD